MADAESLAGAQARANSLEPQPGSNLAAQHSEPSPNSPANQSPRITLPVPFEPQYSLNRFLAPHNSVPEDHPDQYLRAPPGYAQPQAATSEGDLRRMQEILNAIDAQLQSASM